MTEEELTEMIGEALHFGAEWLDNANAARVQLLQYTILMMGITSLVTQIWEYYELLPRDEKYPFDLVGDIAKEIWRYEDRTETPREG